MKSSIFLHVFFIVQLILISKAYNVNQDLINQLVQYGRWSNIYVPAASTHFEEVIVNYAPLKYNLHVDLYHTVIPCGRRTRLYIFYIDRNGMPGQLGPYCGRLHIPGFVSYHGDLRLVVIGSGLPRHLNINVYEKLVPDPIYPITTSSTITFSKKPTTLTTKPKTSTPTTAPTTSTTTTKSTTTTTSTTTPTTSTITTSTTTPTTSTTTTPTTTPITSTTTTSTTTPTTSTTTSTTSTTTPTTTSTTTTSKTTPTTSTTMSTTTVEPSLCGKELLANGGDICFSRPSNWQADCITCSINLKFPPSQNVTVLRFKSFNFEKYDCISSTVILKSAQGVKFYCSDSPPKINDAIIFTTRSVEIQTSINWKSKADRKSGFQLKYYKLDF